MKKKSLPTLIVFTAILMALAFLLGGCPGKGGSMYGGGAPAGEMQARI